MILESEAVVVAVWNNIQTVEMVDRKGIKNNNLSSEIRDLFNEEDEKLPGCTGCWYHQHKHVWNLN